MSCEVILYFWKYSWRKVLGLDWSCVYISQLVSELPEEGTHQSHFWLILQIGQLSSGDAQGCYADVKHIFYTQE